MRNQLLLHNLNNRNLNLDGKNHSFEFGENSLYSLEKYKSNRKKKINDI